MSVVAQEKRSRLVGAVDHIDKPVTRDALIDVIRRSVEDVGESGELAHFVNDIRAATEVWVFR